MHVAADMECVVLLPISAATTTAATASCEGMLYCVIHVNSVNIADDIRLESSSEANMHDSRIIIFH
jgi:hypothetical protein